jgi:hypothetical protein
LETKIFPEKELHGHSPNFHIYIFPRLDLPILLQETCGPILAIYMYIAHRHMNVEIKTAAAQFPEKEHNFPYSAERASSQFEDYVRGKYE